jgi:hypothetical protein
MSSVQTRELRSRPGCKFCIATPFRGDVTLFRLNATSVGQSGAESAFRRNKAERVYRIEAAHNGEVAGSILPPLVRKALETGPFAHRRLCGCTRARRSGFESRRLDCSLQATGGCMLAKRGVSLTPEGMRR